MEKQLTKSQQKTLEKQQYRIIGNHSAVKVCGWTKNKIAGRGSCYKEKFYGINSHQCLQMTSSMFCANRCKFCWRGLKAPISKDWFGSIDNPEFILEQSIKNHINLLQGFKGFKKSDKKSLEEMNQVKHVALSLTGEPITYPKINELIDLFHKRKISTFLVTNGQYPELIKNLNNVTQLYLSLDAPNKELMKKIGNPIFEGYWERFNQSLKIFSNKKSRTCLRMTLIKGENMIEPENYANLIKKANPDFIEVKAYMWVGENRELFAIESMPKQNDLKKFTNELLNYLDDYEVSDEHFPSRVILLSHKRLKQKTKINFNKFFELYDLNKIKKDSYNLS